MTKNECVISRKLADTMRNYNEYNKPTIRDMIKKILFLLIVSQKFWLWIYFNEVEKFLNSKLRFQRMNEILITAARNRIRK